MKEEKRGWMNGEDGRWRHRNPRVNQGSWVELNPSVIQPSE